MYVRDLIIELNKFNKDSQIFISNDAEGNEIKTIDGAYNQEFDKTNNNGTYDAVVLYPTDKVIE